MFPFFSRRVKKRVKITQIIHENTAIVIFYEKRKYSQKMELSETIFAKLRPPFS
jgi:hypothetical protein